MTGSTPSPSGPVTLLFTDVEGSTRLWESEPDAMAPALRRHDEILRHSIESSGGQVFKTVGDAFCAAFSMPLPALDAVLSAQRLLIDEAWSTSRPIRVRMAIHTGVCEERDDDYFGPVVNRAARLLGVAHGGQVLVSGTAATLLEDATPGSCALIDLGLHRLKDLGGVEHVFQVGADFLQSSFPPLRSLDSSELPNNLPSLLSPFVGRERELAEVRRLLGEARLVTLTGAGGAGKTRLALHVAADMVDGTGEGVWFVELAPVADPGQLPSAVAAVLGVKEEGDRSVTDSVLDALSDQRVLILLDNCEHLVDASARFADRVSRRCANVHLLVTSREPLGVDGERVYRVPSLSLPSEGAESLEELEASEAVRLFVQRAAAQDAAFVLDDSVASLVGSICRRLDGIPLALELAVARLSSISLVHLHDRLDQRFRLLSGGSRNALPRQQTLQAMVDWSFDLLTAPEQGLLRRLSVFVSGFELEAAEAVGVNDDADAFDVADLLGSLVDKSLVNAERGPASLRYQLLETISDYAGHALLATEGEAAVLETRDRHASFFVTLAETVAPDLTGPLQGERLKELDLEWGNLRAAFAHMADSPGRSEDVMRLGVALNRFILSRGHPDAVAYLQAAIGPGPDQPTPLLANALMTAALLEGQLLARMDSKARGHVTELADRALAVARALGDDVLEAWSLTLVAGAAHVSHDDRAVSLVSDAVKIARRLNDDHLLGVTLNTLGSLTRATSPIAERRILHSEGLECLRRTGDTYYVAVQLHDLASLCLDEDDAATARTYLAEAVALASEVGAQLLVFGFRSDLGLALLATGDVEQAAVLFRTGLVVARRGGFRQEFCGQVFGAACCATSQGDYVRAARLLGAADAAVAAGIEARNFSWTAVEDRLRNEALELLRTHLTVDVLERDYAAGSVLSGAEIVSLALGRTPED